MPLGARRGDLELAWYSATAPAKQLTEDALLAAETGDGALVAAVLDGMGGMIDGGAAARIGAELLAGAAGRCAPGDSPRAAIVDAIERAHVAVLGEHPGAGATVVAAAIDGGTCQFVHAGDAEGLHLDETGELLHRTVADSPVGFAHACGALTEAEALAHPDRNLVGSGIGVDGMTMRVGPRLHLAAGHTVLLASDGLTDNLFEDELRELATRAPLTDAVAALADLARQRMAQPMDGPGGYPIGKPDDLAILALRIGLPRD